MAMITESEAATEKKALSSDGKSGGVGPRTKTWTYIQQPDGPTAAAYLNLAPAQGAGEAFAIGLPDGQVGLFIFI